MASRHLSVCLCQESISCCPIGWIHPEYIHTYRHTCIRAYVCLSDTPVRERWPHRSARPEGSGQDGIPSLMASRHLSVCLCQESISCCPTGWIHPEYIHTYIHTLHTCIRAYVCLSDTPVRERWPHRSVRPEGSGQDGIPSLMASRHLSVCLCQESISCCPIGWIHPEYIHTYIPYIHTCIRAYVYTCIRLSCACARKMAASVCTPRRFWPRRYT